MNNFGGQNEFSRDRVINEILDEIDRLESEYKSESSNTAKPGNPYIIGLSGRISGLKFALKLLIPEATL
jgi:hypothetical protein